MKRAAIIQSCYIPWKGYFDIINSVDEFVLYDDAQYTKNDWRNRNLIKVPSGTLWLTIPVGISRRFGQAVREVPVRDGRWARRHWKSLRTYYARAHHFDEFSSRLDALYDQAQREDLLTNVNELFIRAICEWLGISTRISRSSEYACQGDRTERLVSLCHQLAAEEYLTGPAARNYLDEGQFLRSGIRVRWMDYGGYPVHRQRYSPPFIHQVSILDLLLNEGAAGAREFLLSTPESRATPCVAEVSCSSPL
ncbi:MAG: WbqC family protein [Acidobacteria bacterium]|nr:WbqC family protein [Acidobacteriota bacterium]